MAIPMCLNATEPEMVELTLDKELEKSLNKNHPTDKWPRWIVNVQQQGGEFLTQPSCWHVDGSQQVGYGRFSVTLDREVMKEDVALAILYEGNERTDLAVQLFDANQRVVVLDLFGNLLEVGRDAKTDTFVVPLRKYPTATTISIRRISGDVKLYGMALYPVVSQAEANREALEQLAKLLGDPLSPENPLAKSIQRIARHSELPVKWPSSMPVRGPTPSIEATTSPRRVSASGLVAYWDFDSGDVLDRSGHHHDGIVHGKPAWNRGIRGTGLHLDGKQDWVEVPHSSELDLKESLTLSVWIKYSNVAGGFGSEILWYGDLQPARDPYTIHLLADGTYQFRIDASGGHESVVADTPQPLAREIWHFLTATMETTASKKRILKTYVNGQLIRVETVDGTVIDYDTSEMWLSIGAVDKGGWQMFEGVIDEVGIYNRALSKDEIRRLYTEMAPAR